MCYFPKVVKPKYKKSSILNPLAIPVGCGKCILCRQNRARQWIPRLLYESNNSLNSYFVTLTLDDDNITYTPNGLPTVNKRDFQLFMKRLRKQSASENGKSIIKYYAVSEYGSKTLRPHYHAIMFNILPETVEKTWQKGIVSFDPVNSSSIAYVVGYVNKYTLKSQRDRHPDDDRENEFNLISQGIGKGLANEKLQHYVNAAIDDTMTIDQQNFIIPRYVKEKINISDDVKFEISLKKKRYFQPLNDLQRADLKAAYELKKQKLLKHKFDTFNKQKF